MPVVTHFKRQDWSFKDGFIEEVFDISDFFRQDKQD